MNLTFSHVVDILEKLSLDEKEEAKLILEKSIIEERREEIYRNHLKSKKELRHGKLKFSHNMARLKEMVEE